MPRRYAPEFYEQRFISEAEAQELVAFKARDCVEIALRLRWDCSGIALGSLLIARQERVAFKASPLPHPSLELPSPLPPSASPPSPSLALSSPSLPGARHLGGLHLAAAAPRPEHSSGRDAAQARRHPPRPAERSAAWVDCAPPRRRSRGGFRSDQQGTPCQAQEGECGRRHPAPSFSFTADDAASPAFSCTAERRLPCLLIHRRASCRHVVLRTRSTRRVTATRASRRPLCCSHAAATALQARAPSSLQSDRRRWPLGSVQEFGQG